MATMQVSDAAPQRNDPRFVKSADTPPDKKPIAVTSAAKPAAAAVAAPADQVTLAAPDAPTKESPAERKARIERRGVQRDRRSRSGENERRTVDAEQADDGLDQAWRKRLLQECENVLAVHYDSLALIDYPDNQSMAGARRLRDLWWSAVCVFLVVAVAGFYGWVPAWIGGTAAGALLLNWVFVFARVRRLLGMGPTVGELQDSRKQVEFRALNHVRRLEGANGLAWRCAQMKPVNSALGRPLFNGLVRLSYQGKLVSHLHTRAHIRLYLQFLLEAERAYRKIQEAYVREHRALLAKGEIDPE